MSVSVHCQNVTKRFGDRIVLDNVSWQLEEGALAGLLGVSGAGKTTLLRIIAGLDDCSSGRVTRSNARNSTAGCFDAVGMVFQNLGLWPHLTAQQHLHCVLHWLRRRERRGRAEQLLREVQLPRDAWHRRPSQLSGGESQRLALARAIAVDPSLLLLDEPLAQVDMALRGELLALIRDLATTRGVTVIYVTHSWHEVSAICDRLAVLSGGQLAQEGAIGDVFQRPVSAAVARLAGPTVEIPLELVDQNRVACANVRPEVCDGGMLVVRPQQVRFGSPCEQNCWRVVESRPFGAGWRVILENAGIRLSVTTPSYATPRMEVSLEIGGADVADHGGLPRALHGRSLFGNNRGN